MPLDAKALGAALHDDQGLTLHSTLCRREAGAFQQAIKTGQDVVVACTQEQRLFAELGQQTEGAISPIRFVNIRETGGWSRDADRATPKIAALLAAAQLPEPEPVPTVTFKSTGRLLIIGALDVAERAAAMVSDVLEVTVFTQGPGAAGARRHGAFRCWAGVSRASRAGWARSICNGRPTTPSTWTCAPAATPAWLRAPKMPSASTTKST